MPAPFRLPTVLIICVCALVVTASPASARAGNHGCNSTEGSYFSSHFFPGGDNITVGFAAYEQTPLLFQEALYAANHETGSSSPVTGASCASSPGTWLTFLSELGPGKDAIRFDAAGITHTYGVGSTPMGKVPPRIQVEVHGGSGGDAIIGHDGHDELFGDSGGDRIKPLGGADDVFAGAGPDVIRAVGGGKDKVRCGAGRDRAYIDSGRDSASGCEVIVRR